MQLQCGLSVISNGVKAIKLERRCILFDISPKMFNICILESGCEKRAHSGKYRTANIEDIYRNLHPKSKKGTAWKLYH